MNAPDDLAGLDPDQAARLRHARRLARSAGHGGPQHDGSEYDGSEYDGSEHRGSGLSGSEPDWRRPARYAPVARRWADLLAADPPAQVQHLALAELVSWLRQDTSLSTASASLTGADADAFHAALHAIASRLDPHLVAQHVADRPGLTPDQQAALLIGIPGGTAHLAPIRRSDAGRGLDRISWYYAGPPPAEQFAQSPAAAKIRDVELLGRVLLHERIVWLTSGTSVTLDPAGLVDVPGPVRTTRRSRVRRVLGERRSPAGRRTLTRTLVLDARVRALAALPSNRRRFDAAWLLMDRDTAAGDNAEHLYRYLREHEPSVNAWFVLSRSSSDHPRLAAEGFRLIDYGSAEHLTALLHTRHLVSSQVDQYVVSPFRGHALGPRRWRFTFLQHGVLRHDLSRWLNPKPIDVFVTSTPTETAAITDDGTPYVFTGVETRMTGLARHDRLLRLAATASRTHLLVMPTWRDQLLLTGATSRDRALRGDFWTSDYATTWLGLLRSPRLRELCAAHGWTLGFVPHPNMQEYLASADLPDHVVALRYRDIDVQELLASAVAVVTDYSSLGQEAAYLERPVVYFQFDRDEFFAGGHFHRLGSWRYETDGFGPVTSTVEATVDEIGRIADRTVDPRYAERARADFPLRDGRCCERTVAAVRALDPAPGHPGS